MFSWTTWSFGCILVSDEEPARGEPVSTTVDLELPAVQEIGLEEGRALFDRRARELVGMSGRDFLEKWDSGHYEDCDLDDYPGIVKLYMLMPLAR